VIDAPNTGTIFDSPWFTLERPAFKAIASWSDVTISMALVVAAIALAWLAMSDRKVLKGIVLAWIVLP
jgi:hypothetical protein